MQDSFTAGVHDSFHRKTFPEHAKELFKFTLFRSVDKRNPRILAAWTDEADNRTLAMMSRSAHALTHDATVLSKHTLLQRRSRGRSRSVSRTR